MNTQALTKYCYDLVKYVGKSDPIIGRDEDIWNVLVVLYRQSKNNPLLIGEHGVGKTSIVKGLDQKIVSCNDVADSVKGVQIIALDTRALVSGGELVERLKSVLKEIEESQQKVILFSIGFLVQQYEYTIYIQIWHTNNFLKISG